MERAEIASLQQLSARTGVSVAALVRLVHGEGVTSDRVLQAVAEVLRPADAKRVAQWAGKVWRNPAPTLPDAARRLTPKQWQAVERLIEAIVDPGHAVTEPTRRDTGSEQSPTMKRADMGLAASEGPSKQGKNETKRSVRKTKDPTHTDT